MYGKTVFISLLLLGCMDYYVMAQEEGTDEGIEIKYEEGPNVMSMSDSPICRLTPRNIRVSRNFWSSTGSSQVCVGVITGVQHCAGSCFSSFYLDPLTLRPVKRCACCQPTAQGDTGQTLQVKMNCRPGNPSVRTIETKVVEARACLCQGC